MLATIGYESASQVDFISTLRLANIEVLIDIRDRAQSRKPGFSKSALSDALEKAGVGYLHFRELGDPKEGRDAARAGAFDRFRQIYASVMQKDDAQKALNEILALAENQRVCLLCYERDPSQCHRKIVSDHLQQSLDEKVIHLGVVHDGAGEATRR